MQRKLINLNKVLTLLKKQYNSDFVVIWRCVKQDGAFRNKGVVTIFKDIVAVTYEKETSNYKISYNFNNLFWYKYISNEGHGLAFSPFFNEEDIIEISGERYIDEKIILDWNIFSLSELGGLN